VKRVAAIDCGTNSIRLLIADVDTERVRLTDITREMKIVRLGEGVDRTGRLSAAALDRTIGALRQYAVSIAATRPQAVRMVATSATRDAENAQEFTDLVKEVLGVAPEVVSGDEEARLSFAGATRELAGTAFGNTVSGNTVPGNTVLGNTVPENTETGSEAGYPSPYLVTDIGGGSTEFVLGGPAGSAASGLLRGCSVDVGCVRMTERHLHGDPPTAAEVAAAGADIDAALDLVAQAIPAGQAGTLIGLAGSVTTVAGIALGLAEYDSARIHHSVVTAPQVHQIALRLLTQTRAERAAIPVMHPGRVDVIGAGALILDRLMTRFGFAEVLVSEHDILDGIAWSLVP
jgi:exopolyphosphatase / guanosine-5'-triphosphate,3'-diphosphate pyrophosphatase